MASQYTQDVEFNSAFDALQVPVHLFTAALITGGKAPPIDRPFRYLDLACGNGLTLAIIADAYPHAEFVGIDINPDHIARAQQRAEHADLGNVSFFEGDVMSLGASDYGQFDYCAVSGVYSWLDAERREKTRAFVSGCMKPGGIIYLDYSSLPGMAQTAPLYRMLREVAATCTGSSAEKLVAATKVLDSMRQSGARFFKANPVAAGRLQAIMANPPEDEAHEVLNLQDNGFWSADVVNDMSAVGCSYLANAGLHHNLPSLSPRPQALVEPSDMPVALQQMLLDASWNVHQRRDIYIKGGSVSAPEALLGTLAELPIYAMPGALGTQHRRDLQKALPGHDFCSVVAERFAKAAQTSATFGELADALERDGMNAGAIDAELRHFLAARLISIAAAVPGSGDASGELVLTSSLNKNILIEDISLEYARPFSSPVAGSRLLLPLKDRLYLWALLDWDLKEAWDKLSDLQDIFRDQQNNRLSADGFVDTIKGSMPAFRKHIVPELIRLRILSQAA